MKHIFRIFAKDLKETLRDRRSLIVMVVMPLVLFPAVLGLTTKLQGDSIKNDATRLLRVGFVSDGPDLGLYGLVSVAPAMQAERVPDTATLRQLIRTDSLDLGLSLAADFSQQVAKLQTGEAFIFAASTDDIARKRLEAVVSLYGEQLKAHRLDTLGLDDAAITPMRTHEVNTDLQKESIGKVIGGFLPYFFIIFCYLGCMVPAIDLFAGEKERGTIETLLSAPIERWKILVGKMLVIVTAGISSAMLSLLGLFVSLQLVADIPQALVDVALDILTPQFILALIGMLLPLVIFFAGIMIPVTVYAKSFKEASGILGPMNMLVVLPAMIGMMPGIELNAINALIPVLNVVLMTKELVAGTVNWGYFLIVMVSLIALAAGSVAFSFKRFGSEKSVLRT